VLSNPFGALGPKWGLFIERVFARPGRPSTRWSWPRIDSPMPALERENIVVRAHGL
jgi:hypothetical protein